MPSYEYTFVEVERASWLSAARTEAAFLDVIDQEGRGGRRLVPMHQPGPVPFHAVLLERETGG